MHNQCETTEKTRIGGELPLFCDRFGPQQPWQSHWLAFSHGRAALAWLLDNKPARSAVICAYTCPSVPAFLARRGIAIERFDIAASPHDIANLAKRMKKPRIIILPSLFGAPPWLDKDALQTALDRDDMLILDAAQTAFGHADFSPPKAGAVLSCPRKTTALADGAVLSIDRELDLPDSLALLPPATFPAAMKSAARALWASGRMELEDQAPQYNLVSENNWPDTPHRMTEQSEVLLRGLDQDWHQASRRKNHDALIGRLKNHVWLWNVKKGTPFSLPIFVANREAVIDRLRRSRIFTSALWPDVECDARHHPVAIWFAKHLVSLPVDQRQTEPDMERISTVLVEVTQHPEIPVPLAIRQCVSTPDTGLFGVAPRD